jgi:hypothetical protein
MERSLLTWSVPNMITIWLMVISLIVVYALGAQLANGLGWTKTANLTANNAGGY